VTVTDPPHNLASANDRRRDKCPHFSNHCGSLSRTPMSDPSPAASTLLPGKMGEYTCKGDDVRVKQEHAEERNRVRDCSSKILVDEISAPE